MTMGAIGDKLEKTGFLTKLELRTLARNYLTVGGTRKAWIEAVDEAAAEMPGVGHRRAVQQDHGLPAPARQPLTSGTDHVSRAQEGRAWTVPPAREPIPGEDQSLGVQQDRGAAVPAGNPLPGGGQPLPVQQDQQRRAPTRNPIASGKTVQALAARPKKATPPAREPSDAYLKAAAESRRATAKVQLELIKTSTGTPWARIKPREFDGMERDGSIAWAIREAYGPFSEKERNMELGAFLPDKIFKRALSIAEVDHVR